MSQYLIKNGAVSLGANFSGVTTGTSVKTMLQFKASATAVPRLIEWGFSFDAPASVTTGKVELIEADNPATVTASVAADITKYDAAALMGGDPTTNLIVVGTTSTGYTSSGEGTTPTVLRDLDGPKLITTTAGFVYEKQYPLGQQPLVQVSKLLRFRVTFTVAVNLICYFIIEV